MTVELKQIDEFKRLLADYQPSAETKQLLGRTPLVIMLGISGSGRNTIINHLVNTSKYRFIVSDTTRPPKVRDGRLEVDGVNYHFRSEAEMLDDLKAGRFLEAELIHNQQVSGISWRELRVAATSGKIPINEVDVGGTESIRRAKPDTQFFFVVPPSYREWLYRLKGREVMSEQELRNRTTTAVRVLEAGLEADDFTFVINDSSHRSAQLIDAQVHKPIDQAENAAGRRAAEKILDELRQAD